MVNDMLTFAKNEEILNEIAAILALGYVRLVQREDEKTSRNDCENQLDSQSKESVHDGVITETERSYE